MQLIFKLLAGGLDPDVTLLSADSLSEMAVTAEESGFRGVALDEHPAPPEYWRQQDGHDSLDPFVGLASVAAATTRIRLFTYATILPFRNPLLLAKAVSTLDVLSKGRVELGIGTGYLIEEFRALGVNVDERNELFDESIEVMKLAWTGETFSYASPRFDVIDVTTQPRPVQKPHPPLWLAGNSHLSLRRAANIGRGWLALPNSRIRATSRRTAPLESLGDLEILLRQLDRYRIAASRSEPIEVMQTFHLAPDYDLKEVKSRFSLLEDLGVRSVSIAVGRTTLSGLKDRIKRIGFDLISD